MHKPAHTHRRRVIMLNRASADTCAGKGVQVPRCSRFLWPRIRTRAGNCPMVSYTYIRSFVCDKCHQCFYGASDARAHTCFVLPAARQQELAQLRMAKLDKVRAFASEHPDFDKQDAARIWRL